jgi:hypothetical protein
MDIKQQTQNVANQGRYGDSMLLHVNPAEVKGLAQAMPITVNPETGQPEAFLPFLAPLLGSVAWEQLFYWFRRSRYSRSRYIISTCSRY